MKTYTIQFNDQPNEVDIHQFLDGLSASIAGEGWFRAHGCGTQRGTLFVDDGSAEWVDEQLESAEWVTSYRTDDDYVLTDSVDGWSVRDRSNQVFWPSSRAETPEEALEALENNDGEWHH